MRIKKALKIVSLISLVVTGATVFAAPKKATFDDEYTQVISINNALANKPENVSATRTPIHVEYFNNGNKRCWQNNLQFGEGVTIHAGPTQGCVEKVSRIEVSPITPVNGRLYTYEGTISININTGKFSNMITIKQDRAPSFNADTGLIDKPGTLKFSNDVTLVR